MGHILGAVSRILLHFLNVAFTKCVKHSLVAKWQPEVSSRKNSHFDPDPLTLNDISCRRVRLKYDFCISSIQLPNQKKDAVTFEEEFSRGLIPSYG